MRFSGKNQDEAQAKIQEREVPREERRPGSGEKEERREDGNGVPKLPWTSELPAQDWPDERGRVR